MTQVALSSDHLFKKANTEELRWSPNVAEVVRVRGVIVRRRPDGRQAATRPGRRFVPRAHREGAVLCGVPARLQRRAGDSRCQVRAKPPRVVS